MRFGIRRGNVAEERDVTAASSVRKGPLNLNQTVGWIGVSPRFQLPEIGITDLTSPAAQAGLRTFDYIISVNGSPVSHWSEFERAVTRIGASPLRITYLRGTHSAVPFVHVELQQPGSAVVLPQPLLDPGKSRRYATGIEPSELFVYSVEPGSPADRIGLRRGDQLIELDGQPILHWTILHQRLAAEPDKTFEISWLSPGGVKHQASFKQELRSEIDAYRQEEQRLVFGASNRAAWKTAEPVAIRNHLGYALGHALTRTGEIITFTAQGFFQIIRGEMSPKTLGGPLTIGYAAGVAAEQGLAQYLWLMALLSINIGLLNFLPIPILDGGLLLFFSIELLKRRPPSARARTITTYIGAVVVAVLVLFALKNDVVRFFLPR
jgi:regulator of sigma E protease